jgi:two-component sensor histidine kinase
MGLTTPISLRKYLMFNTANMIEINFNEGVVNAVKYACKELGG